MEVWRLCILGGLEFCEVGMVDFCVMLLMDNDRDVMVILGDDNILFFWFVWWD